VRNTSLAASIVLSIYVIFSWILQRHKMKRSRQPVEPAAAEVPEEDIEVF